MFPKTTFFWQKYIQTIEYGKNLSRNKVYTWRNLIVQVALCALETKVKANANAMQ